MSNKNIASKLGVEQKTIPLLRGSDAKKWRVSSTQEWSSIEKAALSYFLLDGWNGYAGEGGLILNLIKVLSFEDLPEPVYTNFVEGIYESDSWAKRVYAGRPDFEKHMRSELYITPVEELLSTFKKTSVKHIEKNFNKIPKDALFEKYFSGLALDHLMGFFNSIDRSSLNKLAEIFSKDPYTYRKGWPDLTLWNEQRKEVCFLEVKAPNDRLRASQKIIIKDILKPLMLPVGIVDVIEMNGT